MLEFAYNWLLFPGYIAACMFLTSNKMNIITINTINNLIDWRIKRDASNS